MTNSTEQRIEVSTFFGTLSATVFNDEKYPGIYLCIEEKTPDGLKEKQLATIDSPSCNSEEGKHTLRLLIWKNNNSLDYTDKVILRECNSEEENKNYLWRQYLQYLRDWSTSHSSPEFYGMTPPCFNEWIDNEHSDN